MFIPPVERSIYNYKRQVFLKIVQKIDNNSLIAKYMHHQSWGFKWGEMGDEVQFVSSNTMEVIGEKNIISSIKPYNSDDILGAKEFLICFEKNIDSTIFEKESVGIENLTWCPEVIFTENIFEIYDADSGLEHAKKVDL